jgi:hypothetical protein
VKDGIVNVVKLVVQAVGDGAVTRMAGAFSRLQTGFKDFGVTTIFLDRLMQSFGRGWAALNKVLNISDFTERASKLGKMASGLGMQSDQLSAFVGLSERYGAEINDIPDLIATMQDKLLEFADGNKTVVDNLKGTNLIPEDFVGKGPLDRFLTLVDGLKELDPQTRSAILSRFFGDDLGRKIAPMIAKGSKAIKAEMMELVRTGQVMSKSQIEMGEATRTALSTLRGVFEGFQNNMTQALLPTVQRAAKAATAFMSDLAETAGRHINEMSRMVSRLYNAVRNLTIFKKITADAETTFAALQAGVLGLLTMGMLYLIPLAIAASQFILILGAIGLVAQDIYVYLQGGPSLIGDMLGSGNSFVKMFLGGLYLIWELLMVLKDVFMGMFRALIEGPLLPILFGLIVGFLTFVLGLLIGAAALVWGVFEVLNYGLMGVIGFLEIVIGMLATIWGAAMRIITLGQYGKGLVDWGRNTARSGGGRIKNLFQGDVASATYMPLGTPPAPTQNNIVVNNTVNSVNAPQTAVAVLNDSMTKVGDKVRQ